MTAIAQTYLGNSRQDAALQQRIAEAQAQQMCFEVDILPTDCPKSRIFATAQNGTPIGIIKERGWQLTEGDVFVTGQGQLVVVHLAAQTVMVIQLTEAVGYPEAIALVQLGHALGNHHYPMTVANHKIYLPLPADTAPLDAIIAQFQVPGLCIHYESVAAELNLPWPSPASSPLPNANHTHD